MKIYIITDGQYSDYHIVGAFSTKELALEYIKIYNECNKKNDWCQYSEDNIEEYEIDALMLEAGTVYKNKFRYEFTFDIDFNLKRWTKEDICKDINQNSFFVRPNYTDAPINYLELKNEYINDAGQTVVRVETIVDPTEKRRDTITGYTIEVIAKNKDLAFKIATDKLHQYRTGK